MDLFICTASQSSSLWLIDSNSQVVASLQDDESSSSLSEAALRENVAKLLANLSLTVKDLQQIFAVTGPGSFTSLRKGVNFARGLSLGLGIPLYGIPTLRLFETDVWIPLRPRLAAELSLDEALDQKLEFLQIKSDRNHLISTPASKSTVLGLKHTFHWPQKNEVQNAHRAARENKSDYCDTEIDYGLEVKISGKRQSH